MFLDYDGVPEQGKLEDLVARAKRHGRVAVFDMTDDTKLSCHIIFVDSNMTHHQCKAFAQEHFPDCDLNVYKGLQSLRMPMSTKNNLRLKKLSTLGDVTSLCRECYVQLEDFPFNSWEEYQQSKPPIAPQSGSYDGLLKSHFANTGNRYVRIRPGFCAICSRTHDNENIIVHGDKVKCFRNLSVSMPVIDYAEKL